MKTNPTRATQTVTKGLSAIAFKAMFLGMLSGLFLGCSTGADENSGADENHSRVKIVNGTDVSFSDPVTRSTVAILNLQPTPFGGMSSSICTGTILTSVLVVTAGHCTIDYNPQFPPFVIFDTEVGDSAFQNDRVRRAIAWKTHEGYLNSPFAGTPHGPPLLMDPEHPSFFVPSDIGFVILDDLIPETHAPSAIVPADMTINGTDEQGNGGDAMVFAGFGITGYETDGEGNLIQTSSGDLVSNQDSGKLRKTYSRVGLVLPEQQEIIYGPSVGEICSGDSGGPSYLIKEVDGETRMYLLGVASRAPSTCGEGYGVHTDIRPYLPWIQTHYEEMLNALIGEQEGEGE